MKNLNEKIINRQMALLVEIIETLAPKVLEEGRSADRQLAQFFKKHRELGSRDRRFLSNAFFSFFRWLGWTQSIGLVPIEASAVGWLLDQSEIHPALAAYTKDREPLGDRSLDEKCTALAVWFPEAQSLKESSLLFPEFEKSVDLPTDCKKRFYETLQTRPPTWLRLRSNEFRIHLADAKISFKEHSYVPNAISVNGGSPLGALGHSGQFEVQDIASQAVTLAAAPERGSDWWDVCSGAGGKALHLADQVGPTGKVLATDLREHALHECRRRARVDGLSIIRTQLHDVVHDAPFTKEFDGVLVDAPCSGWGTWSRNPDARWRSDPRDPAQKRNLQLRMLHNAAICVRTGGVLIYAVCTFTNEETTEVLQRFLTDHTHFALEPFIHPLTGESTGGFVQIWPWEGPGDGLFIARFQRKRKSV